MDLDLNLSSNVPPSNVSCVELHLIKQSLGRSTHRLSAELSGLASLVHWVPVDESAEQPDCAALALCKLEWSVVNSAPKASLVSLEKIVAFEKDSFKNQFPHVSK